MANFLIFAFSILAQAQLYKRFQHNLPFSSSNLQNCPKYKCKDSSIQMSPETCVHYESSSNTFYQQQCPYNQICGTTSFTPAYDIQCKALQYTSSKLQSSYPGQLCSKNSDCNYGDCTNNKCEGYPLQAQCTSHGQCSPGLRCSANRCVPQLLQGQKGCLNDFDCVTTAGCNRTETSTGVCIPYFSAPEGAVIGDCDYFDRLSMLCSTLDCADTDDGLAVCLPATITEDGSPKRCQLDDDCLGVSSQGIQKTSKCVCGLNPEGDAYCMPHDGDIPAVNFEKAFIDFINTGAVQECNTIRRFDTNCWESSLSEETLYRTMTTFYYYLYFPYFQSNDVCTYDAFQSRYVFKSAYGIVAGLFILTLN